MEYTIDENNVIRVFDTGADYPFLYQPFWPNGEPFATRAEAESYATVFTEAKINPESAYICGASPETHPMPRPPLDTEA